MARMDSLYLQNLVNSTTKQFHDALNPLIRQQQAKEMQEWQDKIENILA